MDPKQIAEQLRCPHGAQAARTAQRMNEANAGLYHTTITRLDLRPESHVLEIGPGNGAFAAEVLRTAHHYTGLDWSPAMVGEAEKHNRALVASGRATFLRGSSDHMPFPDDTFDRAFSINTLYFWEEPRRHAAEIARVLRPGGLFVLVFGEEAFMRTLPFAAHGFTLYDEAGACTLMRAAGLHVCDLHRYRETGRSNSGRVVDKRFLLLRCEKRPEQTDSA
ncbi:MAG: hypothetical protein KatS3mg043_0439 [Rhodothermaceae bacterium]|nr:MAG: hypothetical protein KatS3mg043_0439 [Rhodothermaceae bacterium]